MADRKNLLVPIVFAVAILCSCTGGAKRPRLPADLQCELQSNEDEYGSFPASIHGSDVAVFLASGTRTVGRFVPAYVLAVSVSPNGTKSVVVTTQNQDDVSLLDLDNGSLCGSYKLRPYVWDGAISDQGLIAVTQAKLTAEGTVEGALVVFQPGMDKPMLVAAEGRDPSFFGNGDQMVYAEGGRIAVYSISSRASGAIASGTNPSVSPDGRWITFRSTDGYFHVVDEHGRQDRKLIRTDGIIDRMLWDPRSKYVLYLRRRLSVFEDPIDAIRFMEARKVIVLRVRDGHTGTIGLDGGLKAPGDFVWIKSQALRLRAAGKR